MAFDGLFDALHFIFKLTNHASMVLSKFLTGYILRLYLVFIIAVIPHT